MAGTEVCIGSNITDPAGEKLNTVGQSVTRDNLELTIGGVQEVLEKYQEMVNAISKLAGQYSDLLSADIVRIATLVASFEEEEAKVISYEG